MVTHCHCGFLKPDQSLLADMRNCLPAQQYKEKLAKKVPTDHDDLERKKAADSVTAKTDLKMEVIALKKAFKERAAKEKEAVTAGGSGKNRKKKRPSKKAPVAKESNPNKKKKLDFMDWDFIEVK